MLESLFLTVIVIGLIFVTLTVASSFWEVALGYLLIAVIIAMAIWPDYPTNQIQLYGEYNGKD